MHIYVYIDALVACIHSIALSNHSLTHSGLIKTNTPINMPQWAERERTETISGESWTYFTNYVKMMHYSDVIMSTMASQITSLTIVCSTFYSGANQRKHQSSASLAFVWGIHRSPVNFPHKCPVTRKMFPFDDVIMELKLISPADQPSPDIGFVQYIEWSLNRFYACNDIFPCIFSKVN